MTGPDPLRDATSEIIDLLDLVDQTIRRHGVPPDHPVADGLREFRALPGALTRALVDTDPEALAATAHRLTDLGSTGAAAADMVRDDLARVPRSTPTRLDVGRTWVPVSRELTETSEALAATAAQGTALAGWLTDLRSALADFFVRHGSGPAAVLLRRGPLGAGDADELARSNELARAAATLAAACYAALRAGLAAGQDLRTDEPGRPVNDPPVANVPVADASVTGGGPAA